MSPWSEAIESRNNYMTIQEDLKQLLQNDLVFFDIETTGLDRDGADSIIEIAAERVRNGKVLGEFSRLVKPLGPIDSGSQAIHGLDAGYLMMFGASHDQVLPEFAEFSRGATLVGHNIVDFDLRFVNRQLQSLQLPGLTNAVFDTLPWARRSLTLGSYSMQSLAQYFGISYGGAHRAGRDVKITREVFYRLVDKLMTT